MNDNLDMVVTFFVVIVPLSFAINCILIGVLE